MNCERLSQSYYPRSLCQVQIFFHLFPSEKLWGWLKYTSMDHRHTSVQDMTATREVKTEQKKSNYYWRIHYQQKARQHRQTTWCLEQAKQVTHTNITPTHESTEGWPWSLLKKFKDWTKPKSNELQAATTFRHLDQKNSILTEFINKATILWPVQLPWRRWCMTT